MNMTITDNSGVEVNATADQAKALEILREAGNGRFISILGYKPSTGYVKVPTVDYTLLSKFSIKRLYERKIEALKGIEFGDIISQALNDEKLSVMPLNELKDVFDTRKAKEIDSLQKSLDGELDNAHTQAHERNYADFGYGVKAHLVTEKVDDKMVPVLTNGKPTIKSVMVTGLTIQKKVIEKGEYKKVNSRAPVRVSNIINSLLNQKSVGLKRFSLKPDNFKEVRLDSGIILNESLKEFAE